MSNIEINWCDRVTQLREIEFARVSGEMVEEARFGADMVRYARASNADLSAAIQYAERQCAKSRGKRSRYALAARARPY